MENESAAMDADCPLATTGIGVGVVQRLAQRLYVITLRLVRPELIRTFFRPGQV